MNTPDENPIVSQPTENAAAPAALALADVVVHEPKPRRKRSLRGRIRRAVRIAEPFALVVGLVLLSTGVVEVVETRVPTRADQEDSARLARAQTQVSAEQRAAAIQMAAVWRKSDLPDWQATAPTTAPDQSDQ